MQMAATAIIVFTAPRSMLFPQLWSPRNPILSLSSLNFHLYSYSWHFTRIKARRRPDSNAEPVQTRSFSFNFDPGDDDDNEDTGFSGRRRRRWWSDDLPSQVDSAFGILEEFIDNVWIFKVFKSFGWMLPFIISSLLLASGPKAFLMALALPIGQSMLSLTFDKLWTRTQNITRRMTKRKKKPRARTAGKVQLDKEEEEKEEEGYVSQKEMMGYHSWAHQNDISAGKGDQEAPSFGGWDELDRQKEFDMASRRKSAQTAGKSRMTPMEKGKLNKGLGRNDTPILLRLLIAVFPFLGSWTKML